MKTKFTVGEKLKTYGGEEEVIILSIKPNLQKALDDKNNPEAVALLKKAIRQNFVEDDQRNMNWYLVKFENGLPTRYWCEDELIN